MVSLQFWKKKADEPISKVLKQLQSQINTHEIRVSALRQKQRSITGQITLYSVLIYLAYLIYYALGRNYELEGQTILAWTAKIVIMPAFPALVYGVRRSVRWWYTRKIEGEVQEKEVLKTRLQDKIEELKEKSDYYNTQQLLERYDAKSSPTKQTPRPPERVPRGEPAHHLHHKPSADNLRHQRSIDSLRQRLSATNQQQPQPQLPLNPSLPRLPPPITPSSFAPLPAQPHPQQNIPQFHPSAFSPPPSPVLPPQDSHAKTFLDRLLDLLVGEDENSADHRYALICRHCKAHNGLAPPGERPAEVGYLCGRCGGWNGPDPKKQGDAQTLSSPQQQQPVQGNTDERETERLDREEDNNNKTEIKEEKEKVLDVQTTEGTESGAKPQE